MILGELKKCGKLLIKYLRSALSLKIFYRSDANIPEKWSTVIDEQHSLHKSEMEYWKEILGSSILVIDQVRLRLINSFDIIDLCNNQIKKTLEGLQATVDHKLHESTAK